jgi:hypothetical protein
MNRRLATALVAGITSLGVMAPMAPAQADTPSCVTRKEYRKVHRGDTIKKVHRIFDIKGRQDAIAHSGGYHTQIRSYHTCSQWSAVSVSFDRNGNNPWKLSAKSAVWCC